ncbi:MAG: stalk domain-containing protein [Desulfotomaculaceae bacterium]|nr:stalk domain-containing protein [Desulfotomaculaceae bacterium]
MIPILKPRLILILTALQLAFLLMYPQGALTEPRVLINKGTNQLALFENGYLLDVFPVATGRQPQFTPEGDWRVVVKLVYPAWRHPDGGPLIPGGVPENPLGPRWLGINALGTGGSSYGVHGNNAPYSIGTYASSGCIRMYNEDIVWLYERIPVGTEVEIVNIDQDLSALKKYNNVTVNGMAPEFPPHLGPVQAGEVTYLPLRQIASPLGYRLDWDDSAGALLVANIEREVLIRPGSRAVTVNTKTYEASDAPFLLDNMIYVPDYYLRNFFEFEQSSEEGSRTLALKAPIDPNKGQVVRYNLAVQFNGKPLNLPESLATLKDGQNLLVPVRPFCTAAGATVSWNDDAKAVEIKIKDKQVSIPVNGDPSKINGVVAETPANIFIHNDTSYLSLGFLQNIFGFNSEYSEQSRTLKISTSKNAQVVFRLLPLAQLSLKTPEL